MVEILDLDTLLAQLVVALGAALVAGNAAAIYVNWRGKAPTRAQGEFRAPRAWFLLSVGLLIGVWGVVSLLG